MTDHFGVAITVVFGMLWFAAMVARNGIVRPQQEVATRPSRSVND